MSRKCTFDFQRDDTVINLLHWCLGRDRAFFRFNDQLVKREIALAKYFGKRDI